MNHVLPSPSGWSFIPSFHVLLKVPAQEMAKGSMGLTIRSYFQWIRPYGENDFTPFWAHTKNTMFLFGFSGGGRDLLTIVYFHVLLSMTKLLERFPTNHGSWSGDLVIPLKQCLPWTIGAKPRGDLDYLSILPPKKTKICPEHQWLEAMFFLLKKSVPFLGWRIPLFFGKNLSVKFCRSGSLPATCSFLMLPASFLAFFSWPTTSWRLSWFSKSFQKVH